MNTLFLVIAMVLALSSILSMIIVMIQATAGAGVRAIAGPLVMFLCMIVILALEMVNEN